MSSFTLYVLQGGTLLVFVTSRLDQDHDSSGGNNTFTIQLFDSCIAGITGSQYSTLCQLARRVTPPRYIFEISL